MAAVTPSSRTPSSDAPPVSSGFSLQLVESAAGRVAWLAPVASAVIVFVQIFQALTQPTLADVVMRPGNRLASLAAVLLGIAIFVLHRYKVVRPHTIAALGVPFEILVAFCISMIETTTPPEAGEPVLGISSVGPWILANGVFIPNRPGRTFATALAAATTWPLAYVINASLIGFPPVPVGQLIIWPFFNYLLAVLAYLVARRIYPMTVAAETALELGSYRLVSRIGEGGMGEVWRASHQMLARAAAIKIVRPQMISGSARQADVSVRRFKREANVIASLQSPHTVYLYDFGVTQDGRFYYVMELLDGISLQTLVSTFGPQPVGRVLAIMRHACRSLAEAHQYGLVHRDLKPSNMMLCKVALRYDFVKVLDFGLAKCVRGEDESRITMDGMTTGTPGYIAPEVALGEPNIDGRADVYALGCVAYFLLTGSLVFEDPNPMSMALKHVQTPPDPPSQRTELPIPPDLEAIVMRCLAKLPADRPSSAGELNQLLTACVTPIWTEAEAQAWWEKHLPLTSTLRGFAQDLSFTPQIVRKV